MTAQNLWGDFGDIDLGRTPTVILREQAGLLRELTNELLEGRVTRSELPISHNFNVSLYVVAPALGGYRVKVVDLTYGFESSYPVQVFDSMRELEVIAKDEEVLVELLKKILSSEEVNRVISTLISESKMSLQA